MLAQEYAITSRYMYLEMNIWGLNSVSTGLSRGLHDYIIICGSMKKYVGTRVQNHENVLRMMDYDRFVDIFTTFRVPPTQSIRKEPFQMGMQDHIKRDDRANYRRATCRWV